MIDPDLIERVRSGEGADRDLDIALWRALFPDQAENLPPNKVPLPWLHCYTSSLDAVASLIGEKLPGYGWTVMHQGKNDGYFLHAAVTGASFGQCNSVTASTQTPARALLCAALLALSAKDAAHADR